MLSEESLKTLWQLARRSIEYSLEHGNQTMAIEVDEFDAPLQAAGAAFVTLHRHGELRGCIGTLEAYQPLVEDVIGNAHAAAFRDPRFPPLSAAELEGLDIHISVLGPAEEMHFDSESSLIAQLKAGKDGLILTEGSRRGTFLPSVWETLPSAALFIKHLKQKAGLPADYWSDTLRVERYYTQQYP